MQQAIFLGITWGLSPAGAKLLQATEISRALSNEENKTVEGNAPTNTKTYEPQELTLSYSVSYAAGVNPLEEWAKVQKYIGKRGALFVGGKQFGASVFMLDSATFNGESISPNGRILLASISLKLTEDTYNGATPGAATENYIGEGENAPAVKSAPVTSAYDIRPTAAQIENAI